MEKPSFKSYQNGVRESGAGFTLIETLIYIGLFAIVIGGGIVGVYSVIESTNANQNHVILQEEANFLFRKIDWALTGATGICFPVSDTSPTLKVSYAMPADCTGTEVLTFNLLQNDIRLARGVQSPVVLNSSSVKVEADSLLFKRSAPVAEKPDAITATFTLATMQDGRPANQDFSFTKYLRK